MRRNATGVARRYGPSVSSILTGGSGSGGKKPPHNNLPLIGHRSDSKVTFKKEKPKQKFTVTSTKTPTSSRMLHSKTFHPRPAYSATSPSSSSSHTGGPRPDTSYGLMPNGGGSDFTPPTPTLTSHGGRTAGGYDFTNNTITIDRGLSNTARQIVREHETAHAAHATYLSLATGDLSPADAENVAENLLLTELVAYQRQAIKTLALLDGGWDPVGRREGSMAASARLYRDNPAQFRRMVLMMYAGQYQNRFTGLNGTDGRPISLRRVAEDILARYT